MDRRVVRELFPVTRNAITLQIFHPLIAFQQHLGGSQERSHSFRYFSQLGQTNFFQIRRTFHWFRLLALLFSLFTLMTNPGAAPVR